MKKLLLSIWLLAITLFAVAQDSTVVQEAREATGLRAEGKIYVVMLVSSTILIGLFIYLIRLDRKITKIEQQLPGGKRP